MTACTYEWRITPRTYALVLDVLAKFGYGYDAEADHAIRNCFGLAPFVEYRIVVVSDGIDAQSAPQRARLHHPSGESIRLPIDVRCGLDDPLN